MSATQTPSPWLTIEELAERWRTTAAAIYKLRHLGKTPRAFKVGKGLRFHIEDLEDWEREHRESSA